MTLLQELALTLKRTPLYDRHVALGAKIVDFYGWALPVQYDGIKAEHLWTRDACGAFDVSHLGEIRVSGPGSFRFLQYCVTNDLSKCADGRMQYSLLCTEQGKTIDDILVYRNREDDFYLIVNASNIARDLAALRRYAPESVKVEDMSDHMACVAIQGPKSEEVMEHALLLKVADLDYYAFREETAFGGPVWISRSGYTGEDGFEIFAPNAAIGKIWDCILRAPGVKPAGLGARNTLRLEAGNPLYGHEIDDTTTPLEAGLGFAVAFDKPGGFVGRDMLLVEREEGMRRKLVGFRVNGRAVARAGYAVHRGGRKIGRVTSGSYAPSLDANIGLAYVDKGSDAPGTALEIEMYGRFEPAEVVRRPFIPLRHKRRKVGE